MEIEFARGIFTLASQLFAAKFLAYHLPFHRLLYGTNTKQNRVQLFSSLPDINKFEKDRLLFSLNPIASPVNVLFGLVFKLACYNPTSSVCEGFSQTINSLDLIFFFLNNFNPRIT